MISFQAPVEFPVGGIAVVFGASGGIGRALASRLTEQGDFDKVVRFSRGSVPAIDLLNEPSLEAAADFASSQGPIRLVVDATGFLHDNSAQPEKSWRGLDPSHMAKAFALNAIGPAAVAAAGKVGICHPFGPAGQHQR